ncbi:MAG TPA: M20 family metallopeptidase [Salinivirgaceae bacterium]|nr:M20 family metallopeptidase [Salinivirgaceae bacterium]HQA76068.1 M20 family metallopeptidase [Salinivirgaceae bacterium]
MEQNKIKELVEDIIPQVESWYKWLHQNPELSGKEFNTNHYIVDKLNKLTYAGIRNIAGTGIVCEIQGKQPGKHIAFRAELDALPIEEKTKIEYKSKNKGVMHACGHDFHMAALLGIATIVSKNIDSLKGKVTFIFQPSEESLPGGALQMIERGLFSSKKPDLIIGQHVLPDLLTGQVGFRSGAYMASGDEIEITIEGKGGHGALPHLANDVVLALSQTIVSLQQIKSRFVNQTEPFVLSFGKIEANGSTNVLPEIATAHGTMRTLNETWRESAKEQIVNTVEKTSQIFGCKGSVNIRDGYPVLINDEHETEQLKQLASIILGEENVVDLPIRMTTDDFSRFAQLIPAVYYRIGVTSKNKKDVAGLHSPTFLPDCSALKTAILLPLAVLF